MANDTTMIDEVLMDEATDWLITMEASKSAQERLPEFQGWLRADPKHEAAYARVSQQWHDLGRALVLTKPDNSGTAGLVAATRTDQARWVWTGVIAAAAVLAVVVFAVTLFRAPPSNWREYSMTYGMPKRIELPDGSVVYLDANTRIRFLQTPEYRKVVLEQGQALFEVKHDVDQSFVVQVNETTLADVGTRFAVSRLANGDVRATVLDGAVRLHPRGLSNDPVAAAQSVLLKDRQVAVVSGGRSQLKTLSAEEVMHSVAWTQGRLCTGGSLSEAVDQFNAHNVTQMVIADPQLQDKHVGGCHDSLQPREFAESLEKLGVTVTVQGAGDAGKEILVLRANEL